MSSERPAAIQLEPGLVLDRYELLCAIARGGMAHVWLARLKGKHGFQKLVAVKTILPDFALDKHFQHMFLDEARIASGVDHPNVAKILDLGEWRDILYLVMEYVDGDPLSRLRRTLDRKGLKLPTAIALRMLADLASGLHAAHELHGPDGASLGVIHRDVSPQNVLVPTNGVIKLIDFGVAKARDRLGDDTSAGFAKGKSRYMAPEQALGKEIDRRADVFALGAVAHELFTGSAPYDGPNDVARLHALMTGAEVQSLPGAPHPAVEKLIVKALARGPDQRFATAAEMRAAIEDAMLKLRVRASSDDVATFAAEHTADRIAERKRIVGIAVDAAAERERLRTLVGEDTVSGPKDSAPSYTDASEAAAGPMPPPPAPEQEPLPLPPRLPGAPGRVDTSVPVASSLHDEVTPVRRRRRAGLVAAAAVLLLAVTIGAGVLARGSRSVAPATVATTGGAPSTTPSVTPSVTPASPTGAAADTSAPAPSATTAPPATSATPKVVHRPSHHATSKPHATAKPRGSAASHVHDVVIQ